MSYLSYKYRIYPDEEQKKLFIRTCGCVRLVYNRCLELERNSRNIGDPPVGQKELLSFLSQVLMNEYPFLRDVEYNALCHAVFNLFQACRWYWDKRSNPPVFKSRRASRNTFTISAAACRIIVGPDYVSMPTSGKVRAVIHRLLPEFSEIHSFTITQESDDKFYCSVLFSYDRGVSYRRRDPENSIGLDYCAKGLFTDSDGKQCNAPRYNLEYRKKLERAQRRLDRKKGSAEGKTPSKNYLKQRKKVNKIYRKIVNCRNDFLHKKSAELVSGYDVICVEDLDMNEMAGNGHNLGKSTMDNAYGRFLELLDYKARDKGKYLIKVDRWFPSSQICSVCGYTQKLKINQRVFNCPRCGSGIDRDYNAAINIRREGMRIVTAGSGRYFTVRTHKP